MNGVLLLIFFSLNLMVKAKDPLGSDISGDCQIGVVEQILKKPLVVRLTDSRGKPQANVMVKFSILEEPKENIISNRRAKPNPEIVRTNPDGYAMTELQFGKTKGNYYILAEAQNEMLIFKEVALDKNWVLVILFSIIGGLGLFIFGMNYGSKGLVRAAGAKLRDLLFYLTKNRIMSLLIGILGTFILGSSTATSILLVRFASNGLINLFQALGVLLGADIGTTIAVQILAFNILDYAILIVGIGFFLMHLFPGFRNLGQAIFGLGLLFFSLRIMSLAAANLRYVPSFTTAIAYLSNYPILGIIVAGMVAFLLHSSAATIGIILILSFDALIDLPQAIPLILGANLGTVFSAMLAADRVDGRRVAFAHLTFKLLTIIIIFPFFSYIPRLINLIGGDTARQIANFHTVFNLFSAAIFLPLLRPVESFLQSSIKETKREILRIKRLDPAFLSTPAIALGQAKREILNMADIVIKMLDDSIGVFENKDNTLRKKIIETDDEVDKLEETITPYLTKISEEEIDSSLSYYHGSLLGAVTELEHIGDVVSKNLMVYAKKQISQGLVFSEEGFNEIKEMHKFVLRTLRISVDALTTDNKVLAREAVERKELGYNKSKDFNARHLNRLRRGLKESLDTSTIHLDLISDLERINFHASVIAEGML